MKTLIWKEWREQRLFFFMALGIIILSRIVPYFLPERTMINDGYEMYALAFSSLLPVLFFLLLGAASFTNEFTKNTKSFLLSQPLTSIRLFWTKFFSGLILLFALVFLTQFVFLILPFKGTSIIIIHLMKGGDWLTFLSFSLLMVILYSAACFSSLLLKNSLTAIICTPFVLLFGILLALPLAVVLFLISSSWAVFTFLVFSALIAVFLFFSFLIWQKAIVKDVSPAKTIFATTAVILLISFGSHALANLVISQKLNKTIRQAKAEGIKLTPQEVILPLVSDKDNAALVYQQAFDLIDTLRAKYKEEWKYMPYESGITTEKITSQQKNVISKIMKDPEFAKFYILLERAVNLPSCRFNLRYEDGPAILLPHLAKMRSLERLLAARTYIFFWEGRNREAWKSAEVALRLGDSLTNEPILISQLVRMVLDEVAEKSVQPLLNIFEPAISPRDYQRFILEIDKKYRRITKGLEGESAIFGTWSFSSKKGIAQNISGSKVFNWIYFSNLGRPICNDDHAFYIWEYSKLFELSQKPFLLAKNEIDEWERNLFPIQFTYKHFLSSILLSSLSQVLKQQPRYNVTLDSFKLVIALKIYKQKHGYYPDRLVSLSPEVIPELPLDPFTGKDYIYRKVGRGFILYSVGPNEKDDNGIYDQKQSDKYDDIACKVLL